MKKRFMLSLFLLLSVLSACSGGSNEESKGDNASLAYLSVSAGEISPEFSSDNYYYTCDGGSSAETKVRADAEDSSASIKINGCGISSGVESSPISLSGEHNSISVVVTAEDGTIKTYVVDVVKSGTMNVSSPVLSQGDGTAFRESLVVSMSCATSGAAIYYTTDGSNPSDSSDSSVASSSAIIYSSPITITETTTIRAKAFKSGYLASNETRATYTRSSIEQVSTPVMTPGNGTTFVTDQTVSITCATSGVSIYYTTDGTVPSSLSLLYTGSFVISSSCTVNAIAIKNGMLNSAVSSAAYSKTPLSSVSDPVYSPVSGTSFQSYLDVSISCSTSGASIYYTTNGSTPTSSSSLYVSPVRISESCTLKAIAVKSNMSNSQVVPSSYVKDAVTKVATPVIMPSSGSTFTSTISVTITCSTSDAAIYYTTNGDTPTSASSLYSGAITLSESKTVKAIGIKSGFTNSDVASASYIKGSGGESLETAYYKTNPDGQVGKYKSGMNVSCSSMKSDGFSDWSSDLIIAQGVANDIAQSFRGTHEAPIYDTYALYAAWDDTNLYLGWQYVNVVDVVDPAQGFPISDNGKPWNGDIRITLAFDIDSSKNIQGCLTDGVTGVWDATGIWYNKFNNGMDILFNFSSKPGVGTPGVFYPNSSGLFSYNAALCKSFSALGVVYGYVDGLLPANVYGINKSGASGSYFPSELTGSTGFVDLLTKGHAKSHDTFYEMKIPFSVLGITRSSLESNGIGVMLISTFGCSATGSIPYDPTVYDVVTDPYGPDASSSAEKNDVDVFTYKMARIGKR